MTPTVLATKGAIIPAAVGGDIGCGMVAGKDYASIDRCWPLALWTLGGGNHFIDLATGESGAVWVTLHSGSRGIGRPPQSR